MAVQDIFDMPLGRRSATLMPETLLLPVFCTTTVKVINCPGTAVVAPLLTAAVVEIDAGKYVTIVLELLALFGSAPLAPSSAMLAVSLTLTTLAARPLLT